MPNDTAKLPRRFHIGTQKAGSTYLYNLLENHPHTTMSTEHKVCFFSAKFDKGLDWYKSVFPEGEYKIDTTPNGLKYSVAMPKRISKVYQKTDDLQFVVLLRNPIDYVASHFHMHKKLQKYEDDPDHYPKPSESIMDYAEKYPEYFQRGMYADLLDDWLAYFDKSQIKIFLFEEFIDETQKVTTDMLEFWGIPEPERKLEVNEVSRNKAMKYAWAYTLRGKITEHEWLKDTLKTNAVVNWFVDTFLNTSPSGQLNDQQRRKLADVFAEDVSRLEDEYGLDTSRWADFE